MGNIYKGTNRTRILFIVCLGFFVAALMPTNVEASHIRYATLSYVSTGNPGEVEFRFKIIIRGNRTVGSQFNIGINTGEGNIVLSGTVTNNNTAENYYEAEATGIKTYSGTGPFLATWQSCCRIYGIGNASSASMKVSTIVRPFSGNNSPVTNQFPVVNVGQSSSSSFFVSAADPDGDNLRYRIATPSESMVHSAVPNLSINPNTGEVTWDNSSLTLGSIWALQVIVEDLDGNGQVKSSSSVDFLMQVIGIQAAPPSCDIYTDHSVHHPLDTSPGSNISFTAIAYAGDPGVNVSLAVTGLPSGSSMTPTLPVSASDSVKSDFSWTPTAAQSGTYVITFSSTDQYGQQVQCNQTVNVLSNQPPVADAGEDITETATGQTTPVTLDGSGSSDPDGDTITYSWSDGTNTATGESPTLNLADGVYTFTLTVSDGQATDTDVVTVTVENTIPVADAGADQLVECPEGFTLDASNTSDADGDDLTYTWTGDFGSETGEIVSMNLPLGSHMIILTVEDTDGGSDQDTTIITVEDTTPPELITHSEPFILWPPNHKYHTFRVSDMVASISDACDPTVVLGGVVITKVQSDEPEEQDASDNAKGKKGGGGDGKTSDDIVIDDDGFSVDLRAERLGGGNGRVYTIFLAVEDGSGNLSEASYQVHVPQNPKTAAIDDGLAYGYEVEGVTLGGGTPPIIFASVNDDIETTFSEENESPESFKLNQNYPNPFNPTTTISYSVPANSMVNIQVYDLTGRLIATLVNSAKSQGNHQVTFDAENVNSGIYLYRMTAGNYTEIKKMTLIK